MKISASVQNDPGSGEQRVTLTSGVDSHSLSISPKSGGGSIINGGELLFLALATCYCNDIYREARKRDIRVDRVEVQVSGDFGLPGEPASAVSYRAKVFAQTSEAEIKELMLATDRLAEIQNTVRTAIPVTLANVEAIPTGA